jgi:uncharacterized protein YndB with AHSA1/START domain
MARSVEVSLFVRTTPERILDAFLRPEALGAWWGVERTLVEPRNGGVYALVWGVSASGIKYISSGRIASFEPSMHLHIDTLVYFNPEHPPLGPMRLDLDVTIEGNGSRLHLVQDGYESGEDWDWYYAAVHEAWPKVLENLKRYLEESSAFIS